MQPDSNVHFVDMSVVFLAYAADTQAGSSSHSLEQFASGMSGVIEITSVVLISNVRFPIPKNSHGTFGSGVGAGVGASVGAGVGAGVGNVQFTKQVPIVLGVSSIVLNVVKHAVINTQVPPPDSIHVKSLHDEFPAHMYWHRLRPTP